jgi:hypothetical protein
MVCSSLGLPHPRIEARIELLDLHHRDPDTSVAQGLLVDVVVGLLVSFRLSGIIVIEARAIGPILRVGLPAQQVLYLGIARIDLLAFGVAVGLGWPSPWPR